MNSYINIKQKPLKENEIINVSKSFTEGECIFTEHNIETQEDDKYFN